MNKTRWLNQHLGGTWTYVGRGGFMRRWECSDGRAVYYTAASFDDDTHPWGLTQCWISTPGQPVKAFQWRTP